MNVINDNWIFVRYLNDEVKQISVRQAFIDADKIKNIETPTFHNVKVYIYDVPVIQFLVIILLAAYFKPENSFKAANRYFSKDLMENGWDLDLILNYLDSWENRFNIDDNNYPFLQDIRLKSILNYDNVDLIKYVPKINILAPSTGNPLFEHNSTVRTEIKNFKPTLDEFIYLLIYNGALGTSINADNYPGKSLNANGTLFAVNYSNTLKETILCNCLPLQYSNDDENTYDRPVWELDNRDDVLKYDYESISKNILMCSFFPSLPLLAAIKDSEVVDVVWANRKHEEEQKCIISKDIRESIGNTYVFYNPWAIKYETEDDYKNKVIRYKNWKSNLKLINLCIDITKHLPNAEACNIISSVYQENKSIKTVIYYREYDTMKCNVLSFGKYELDSNVLSILEKLDSQEKALEFQNIIDKIMKKFNEFNNSGITKTDLNMHKLKFSKLAENYFFTIFINEIAEDTIIQDSINYLTKEAKLIVRQLDKLTSNPLAYATSYRKFCGGLNKLKEEIYGTTQ